MDANAILEIIKEFFAAIAKIFEALGIFKPAEDETEGDAAGDVVEG